MQNLINFDDVNTRIITIRNQNVILDSDVAVLYGVQTRDINKSVSNNLDKFPDGYVIELDKKEFADLKWKISTSSWGGTRKLPKAFTEKGLYMLATILKSSRAIQTTIAIVETFTKIRELSRLATLKEKNTELTNQLQTISLLVINEVPLTKEMIMEIIGIRRR